MRVNDLQIPGELTDLINAGIWPTTEEQVASQNLEPILGPKAARPISPEEDQIILSSPPFRTICDDEAGGNEFWSRDLSNVGEIDYSRAVIIAG